MPTPSRCPSDQIDGWEPKEEWHLENLLDDSHNIPGCNLTDVRAPVDQRLGRVRADDVGAPRGTSPAGLPALGGLVADYRQADPRRDCPAWKRPAHLRKNYDLLRRHTGHARRWAKKWGLFTDMFPPLAASWSGRRRTRLACGTRSCTSARPASARSARLTCLLSSRSRRPRIVGPRERRLSPRETARLQGLPDCFDFGDQPPAATYKQMGNGVNVGAVWHVLREHVLRRGRTEADRGRGRAPRGFP